MLTLVGWLAGWLVGWLACQFYVALYASSYEGASGFQVFWELALGTGCRNDGPSLTLGP